MKDKLILRRYGLHNPTMVECGEQILVTQGLDIKTLCNTWRSYFGIKCLCFGKIDLYIENEKDFNSMQQRTLKDSKSVKELFEEQGFVCKLLSYDEQYDSNWKLLNKYEIDRKDNTINELIIRNRELQEEIDKLRAKIKNEE